MACKAMATRGDPIRYRLTKLIRFAGNLRCETVEASKSPSSTDHDAVGHKSASQRMASTAEDFKIEKIDRRQAHLRLEINMTQRASIGSTGC